MWGNRGRRSLRPCWLEKTCGVGDNATPRATDLNDVHVVASEVYLPMKGSPFLQELHARPSLVRIVSEFPRIVALAADAYIHCGMVSFRGVGASARWMKHSCH